MTITATPPITTKGVWLTLIVVLLADAMDLIDSTITNIAAPSIVADLGADQSVIKWLGAAYALALGSLLVLGGKLGDKYGQKETFLVGMAGFVVASATAGLALSPEMLIGSRVAQGLFGALLIPQGMAIMTATFPKPMLQKAFGVFAPMLGVFAVGGPILGGVLIDANLFGLEWRPIFLINLILGGVAFVMAVKFLPSVPARPSTRIDVLGSVLLAVALFGVLFGLIEGSSDGWTALSIGAIIVGAIVFAGFVWRQARTAEPLLPRTLLANRGFTAGLIVGLLVFAGFSGLMYVISLFFQLGLGYTPTQTSLNLIPLTIGIMGGSGIAAVLVVKLARRLVVLGLVAILAGIGIMLAFIQAAGLGLEWWQAGIATLLMGVGAGICFSSIFNTALGDVDAHEAGSASGSLSAVQQVANGIGSALVTSIFLTLLPSGDIEAASATLVGLLVLVAACLLVVPLLPRTAVADIE
ncbi:MFS transporter [Cryobacterium sp. W22_MBD10_FK3]|uniref:MFS transporter n=1 Tax=Cryobacterium sp. W22_MBD10_FK3 TaxID=3240273 RepID=UPI003F91E8E4